MHAVRLREPTKDFHVGFWRPRPRRAIDGVTLDVALGEVLGGHRTLARGLVSPRGDRAPPRAADRPAWSGVSPAPFDPDGQGVAGISSFTVADRAAARGDPVIT
jgi:hypothetical protein